MNKLGPLQQSSGYVGILNAIQTIPTGVSQRIDSARQDISLSKEIQTSIGQVDRYLNEHGSSQALEANFNAKQSTTKINSPILGHHLILSSEDDHDEATTLLQSSMDFLNQETSYSTGQNSVLLSLIDSYACDYAPHALKSLPDAIKALNSTGFSEVQKFDLLVLIIEKSTLFTNNIFDHLPVAIEFMDHKDWTLDQKYDFLVILVESAKDSVDTTRESLTHNMNDIESINQSGWSLNQKIGIINAIKPDSSNDDSRPFQGISDAIHALIQTGFNSHQIKDLFESIKINSENYEKQAFAHLPDAIKALNKTDFNNDQKSDLLLLIVQTSKAYAAEALELLPFAIEFMSHKDFTIDQQYNFITRLVEPMADADYIDKDILKSFMEGITF